MRKKLPLVAILGLLFSSPAYAHKYSLEELISRVEVGYPGVEAARYALKSSQALLSQAKYSWLPTGDITFLFTGNIDTCNAYSTDPVTHMTTATPTADCSQDPRSFLSKINGIAGGWDFNITQPLYTFGKIESASGQAKAGVQASKDSLEAAKQDAVYNAIRAYWGLKWARVATGIVEDGISKLKEWIDKIADEMEGANKGNYTEADLARMKAALDNAELVRVDIQRGLVVAEVGLRVMTGDPAADVDDRELAVLDVASQPLEFFQEEALSHRPETKLLESSVVAADYNRKWRLADMLPNLGLRITSSYRGYAASGGSALVQFNPSNGIPIPMIVLNQPLDFGVRAARLWQAKADERAAEERRRQALGGIAVEVATAYANHDEARNRELKLAHGEKVARGWYSIVDRNMAQGLVASTDARELTDAARTYFDFRLRHMQAIMDTNITFAWLKRTAGMK